MADRSEIQRERARNLRAARGGSKSDAAGDGPDAQDPSDIPEAVEPEEPAAIEVEVETPAPDPATVEIEIDEQPEPPPPEPPPPAPPPRPEPPPPVPPRVPPRRPPPPPPRARRRSLLNPMGFLPVLSAGISRGLDLPAALDAAA